MLGLAPNINQWDLIALEFEALVLKALSQSPYEQITTTWVSVAGSAYSLDRALALTGTPSEQHVQAMLANFHACLISSLSFTMQSVTPEKIVREFSLFSASLSNMPKYPTPPSGAHYVERCLTIEVQGNVVGAIYFTIDLDYRTTYINTLEVKAPYQKNHIGCFLLQSAMYVGLLYGCASTCLFPLPNAIPFYVRQGFVDYVYQMKCDLTLPESQTLFLESIRKNAPHYVNEIKQSIQRAQLPQMKALFPLTNPLRMV